jgi:site-specific recombinase XerD
MEKDKICRNDLLEEFQAAHSNGKEKFGKRTIDSYLTDLKKLLPKEEFSNYTEITDTLTKNLYSMNEQADITLSTKNRRLAAGKSLVKLLETKGRIGEGIEIPQFNQVQRGALNTISLEDFEKIIESMPSSNYWHARDKLIYSLIYNLGLRESEVARLKVKDITTENAKTYIYAGQKFKRRRLEVDKLIAQEINNYKELYSKAAQQEQLPDLESGSFFRNKYGKRINERSFRRIFKEQASKAGVNATLLMLRHSYIKMQLLNGVSQKNLSKLTGTTEKNIKVMTKFIK